MNLSIAASLRKLAILTWLGNYVTGTSKAADAAGPEADGVGSSLALRLHGLTVHNRAAGSYGALSTTVQLKGFNLDVVPAPVRGLQGKLQLYHAPEPCMPSQGLMAD